MNIERKTVIFVSTQMEAGGVQIRAKYMSDRIRSGGGKSKLIFLYKKRDVFHENENIIVLHDGKYSSPFKLALSLFNLIRIIKNERPIAVVGMAHYASPIATFAGWVCRVPYRIATQTNPPESHGRISNLMDSLASRIGFYTHNVATSESILKCFDHRSESYRNKLQIIYNGIRPMQSNLSKQDARIKFGLPKDKFLITNCGRLSEQKNQAFLLDILRKIPDAHLAIMGEGELRGSIEDKIIQFGLSDRVTLLGEMDTEIVKDFLACGDIFLFPSLYEAFGLAVVEAMSAGLPVISSDYPALVEVLNDGAISLPLDVDKWVEQITMLRSSREMRLSLSEKAVSRSKVFTLDKMTADFSKLWSEKL